MLPYVKIIRPINLLLIIVAQFLINYFLFEPFEIELTLTPFSFLILVMATVCIAAGGNIINDIYDVGIDTINKPKRVIVGKSISEKTAYTYYMLLTSTGVVLGFVLSNVIGKSNLAVVFILVAALLYWYASFLKSVLLLGNILISLLVGFSLLLLVLFNIFPSLNEMDKPIQLLLSKTVLGYAIAAFYFNLMREIVKDIQDINGDKNGGRTTLPMVLGISRTTLLLFAMALFGLFLLLLFCYHNLYTHPVVLFYFIFLICGPLLVFAMKAWSASKPKDFQRLSLLLKIIMFIGVLSIPFYAKIL
ncbi:MAG: geranylgeranylglycerol-phosphate geranylgeranyltransferase [Flavobacteriaceae bacterium]